MDPPPAASGTLLPIASLDFPEFVSGDKAVRVLVVEDDSLIREMLVESLRDEGFDVIQAADGSEAMSWCKRREADVLVTDIVLPGGIDGWQIAERCRGHHPELLVIYVTGFSPVAARPVPGSLSLQKPYLPAEIVAAVRSLSKGRTPSGA